MKYVKDGITMVNKNAVCDSLFIKQGWVPVEEDEIDTSKVNIEDDSELFDGDDEIVDDGFKVYKKGDFATWSTKAIIELGESLGYVIDETKKGKAIESFLAQQEKVAE